MPITHNKTEKTMDKTKHKKSLLIEIGTEELPGHGLFELAKKFQQALVKGLAEQQVVHGPVKAFVTPRRLAVLIQECPEQTPNIQQEKRGPSFEAAFDASGAPTKAALHFASGCGQPINEIPFKETPKGKWLHYVWEEAGRSVDDFMPELLTKVLNDLPVGKRMRWGDQPYAFLRPIHWVAMQFDRRSVAATVYGLPTVGHSFGHRFLAPQKIEFERADDYEAVLEKSGFVIADFEKRHNQILERITAITQKNKIKPIVGEKLLAEVTGLVEYPEILLGRFEESFLALPREVLITAMQAHQRCFACEDAEGNLVSYFVIVSNLVSKKPEVVIAGNERVMRARLQDAVFHFEADSKISLADHALGLDKVVFQAGLGNLAEKTQRLRYLSRWMAQALGMDVAMAERAAALCKADLLTHMVIEFPELQGIMGKYYAALSGEPRDVALSLEEHYLPRFAEDRLPSAVLGGILSLADKVDNLVGLFGVGKAPTGDKDPFALRRQALAVVRLCVEKQLDVDVKALLLAAKGAYGLSFVDPHFTDKLLTFCFERFKTWFQDNDLPLTVFEAVAAVKNTNFLDFSKRARAVQQFTRLPEAESLITANKRVKNILAKQGTDAVSGPIDRALLRDEAEKHLVKVLFDLHEQIESLVAGKDYQGILMALSKLQQPVDAFFEQVLVMAEEVVVRTNRLNILRTLQSLFLTVADVGCL